MGGGRCSKRKRAVRDLAKVEPKSKATERRDSLGPFVFEGKRMSGRWSAMTWPTVVNGRKIDPLWALKNTPPPLFMSSTSGSRMSPALTFSQSRYDLILIVVA